MGTGSGGMPGSLGPPGGGALPPGPPGGQPLAPPGPVGVGAGVIPALGDIKIMGALPEIFDGNHDATDKFIAAIKNYF